MVKYRYDTWECCRVLGANGNEITNATHIGNLVPFRYRSYYYDTKTDLYFLQSRHYDPEVGRFITIDEISYLDSDSINGLNLYAYCLNNPIMYIDPNDNIAITAISTALIIAICSGAAIRGTFSYITAYNEGVRGIGLFGEIAGAAILGAAMGAILVLGGAAGLASLGVSIAGYSLSGVAAFGISMGIGVGASLASYSLENGLRTDREWTLKGFTLAGLSGAIKSITTFATGYFGGKIGAFDNLFLDLFLRGAETISRTATYEISKAIMAHAFPSVARNFFTMVLMGVGETIAKWLLISSIAFALRTIVDKLFEKSKIRRMYLCLFSMIVRFKKGYLYLVVP